MSLMHTDSNYVLYYHSAYSLKGLSNFNQQILNMFFAYASFTTVSRIMLLPLHVFGNNLSDNTFSDPRRFKLILWSLIGATRGGPNRARILNLLITESLNPHQIAKRLNLDHKTIRHHLKILTKNLLVVKSTEDSYGAIYILTPLMQENIALLQEIVAKIKEDN